MRVFEVQEAMDAFNKNKRSSGQFRFQEIVDNSLTNERIKTLHNVLINDYCRIISMDGTKKIWRVEVLKYEVVFKGSLQDCFVYIEKNKLCGKKKRK